MKELFQNQKVINTFRLLRPWLTFVVIFLILKYSGAFTGLSLTSSSWMNSANTDDIDAVKNDDEDFNYDFSVEDINGNVVNFSKFKGKTVFLNLWATWCGPCVAEMPSIESLYGKINKEKVEFVVLNWYEDSRKVSKFIGNKKFTFPVYLVHGDVPPQLNVPSIPTTFVITPAGKIITKKTGTANYDTDGFKEFLERQ